MNIKLIIDVAIHLLKARLKQSLVAAAGVTFGIAMFISLVGFMNGLNDLLDGLMLNRTPHVLLHNDVKPSENQAVSLSTKYQDHVNFINSIKPKDRGKSIYNSGVIIQNLKKDERIIDVAPKVKAAVLFNSGTIEIAGFINGIDLISEDKLFNISGYIKEGSIQELERNNSIIIGKGLADKMLLTVGDIIKVSTSRGDLSSLKIAGITETGIADIDNVMSYSSIKTAQKILGEKSNYITDIQVNLHNINLASTLAKEFQQTYKLDALDFNSANAQFETGSSVRSIVSYAVGVVLLIVAGFGIYNILNMLIYEKMDSIAILKATGFSGTDVKWIFISLSAIIGVTGGILGLFFGYTFSSIINMIPFDNASLPTVKTYPVDFNPAYYVIGLLFALLTTLLSGLFPAIKASKVDPVEIIRGK